MYPMPVWEGLRKVHSVNVSALDAGKVGAFTNNLTQYLSLDLISELSQAILQGPIHGDSERKTGDYRGTFLTRVQSYLWKQHGIQFEQKCNILNDAYTRATKCEIPFDLYGRWDKSFNWTPGDFGDGRSCFWTQHSATRYFLKHWEKSIAFQLYQKLDRPGKDIKERVHHKSPLLERGDWYQGYGRCWVVVDWPHEGLILVFNSYPSGENLPTFTQAVITGLSQDSEEPLLTRTVEFRNSARDGGWFYTNSGTAMAIGTKKLLDKLPERLDLKKAAPVVEDFEEYGGKCLICRQRLAWKDRPAIADKNDGDTLAVCEQCVAQRTDTHFTKCGICGSDTFFEGSGRYEKFESSAKLVSRKKGGGSVICCPTCHNDLDRNEYSSKWKKEVEEAPIISLREFQQENFYDEDEEAYEEFVEQEELV